MNNSLKFHWLVLAGILGGLTEVIWISLYSFSTGTPIAPIANAITATVYPAANVLLLAPVFGLVIHMILSVMLALGFGYFIWPLVARLFRSTQTTLIASITTLALVWKINFFVLLPTWNPEFISLLPLETTLVSKLLFGVTMGFVLTVQQQKSVLPH